MRAEALRNSADAGHNVKRGHKVCPGTRGDRPGMLARLTPNPDFAAENATTAIRRQTCASHAGLRNTTSSERNPTPADAAGRIFNFAIVSEKERTVAPAGGRSGHLAAPENGACPATRTTSPRGPFLSGEHHLAVAPVSDMTGVPLPRPAGGTRN